MAGSRFEQALDFTLGHEGGYVDHPDDPGGATNLGISLRSLRHLEADHLIDWDIDGDGDVDAQDMRLVSRAQAADFYKRHFWLAAMDRTVSPGVAVKLFDVGVNMGVRQAGRLLQRALIHNGKKLVADGAVGPVTLRAIDSMVRDGENKRLLEDFAATQARFYFNLVDRRPARQVFLVGWLRRAYALPLQ